MRPTFSGWSGRQKGGQRRETQKTANVREKERNQGEGSWEGRKSSYKENMLRRNGGCQAVAVAVAAELTEHGISDAVKLENARQQSRLGKHRGRNCLVSARNGCWHFLPSPSAWHAFPFEFKEPPHLVEPWRRIRGCCKLGDRVYYFPLHCGKKRGWEDAGNVQRFTSFPLVAEELNSTIYGSCVAVMDAQLQ